MQHFCWLFSFMYKFALSVTSGVHRTSYLIVGSLGASLPSRRRVDVRSSPASRRASNTAIVSLGLAASQALMLTGARAKEEGGALIGAPALFSIHQLPRRGLLKNSEDRMPPFVAQLFLSSLRNPSRLGTDGGQRQSAQAAQLGADPRTQV